LTKLNVTFLQGDMHVGNANSNSKELQKKIWFMFLRRLIYLSNI
jgi:hypothetical protein